MARTARLLRWSCTFAIACAALLSSADGQESGLPSEAAEAEELETDRDSFTFATSTAGRKLTITEASYSFIDNRSGPESHSFPELLVRHGISENVELRLGWNYEAGGPGTVSGNEVGGQDLQVETEGRILYGAKFLTSKQSGWTPASAAHRPGIYAHGRTFEHFHPRHRRSLRLDVLQRLGLEFVTAIRHGQRKR